MKKSNKRDERLQRATATGWAIFLLAAGAAHAQETAGDADVQEVIVTGIRAGIEEAIAAKRDSGSIVEAISAEDIGKLPDTSIAESLARLPGLTSQRANGRPSDISVRGTAPGFTTALLNGREQASTGDNRNLEFDQYPSELLSSVLIYKTPDAGLVGQGLAATVDLRTQRPLEYGRRALAFNLRGEKNSNSDLGSDSKDTGFRASFSYIDQFADDTVGLTFGYTHLDSPIAGQEFGTYEPWHPNGPNGTGQYVTDGMKSLASSGKDTRDGVMAALEFRPTDNYTSIVDLYYTKSKRDNDRRSLEVNLGGYPGPCCDGTFPDGTLFGFSNPTIVDNTIVAGTINTVVPLARNFLFKKQDEVMAGGWNNKFTMGDWTLTGDLSYSRAERKEQQYETNAQFIPNLNAAPGTPRNVYDNGTFALRSNGFPTLSFGRDYANAANIQVGPTIYGAGYSKFPEVTDTLKSVRLDAARTLDNWFDSVAFGVNYSDRTKDKFSPEAGLGTKANATGNYHQISSDLLLSPINLGYTGSPNALAWDVPGVLNAYYNPIVPSASEWYLAGKNWKVFEKLTTGYVRGNLNHEISDSLTLKGNVGVQIVQTDQSSDAAYADRANGDVLVPVTDGKKYTDILPSINLAFMFQNDQALRIGIAREVARPRMDQLKAAFEFSVDTTQKKASATGGNPRLNPWRADAFDVSYEKYFGTKAYVSAAAFYKKLKTYIFEQTNSTYDFSAQGIPLCGPTPGPNEVCVFSQIGSFKQQLNGQGGTLKGVELSASLPGEILSDALSGFGAVLSVSLTDSKIKIDDAKLGSVPLPGLSKTVWSVTAYYEAHGFSARVSTRARSKFIGEITDFAAERNLRYIKGDQFTDFQTSYEFSEGYLKGFTLLFQVNNVTNEPYVAYNAIETRLQDYNEYGRQFLIGFNYKL